MEETPAKICGGKPVENEGRVGDAELAVDVADVLHIRRISGIVHDGASFTELWLEMPLEPFPRRATFVLL